MRRAPTWAYRDNESSSSNPSSSSNSGGPSAPPSAAATSQYRRPTSFFNDATGNPVGPPGGGRTSTAESDNIYDYIGAAPPNEASSTLSTLVRTFTTAIFGEKWTLSGLSRLLTLLVLICLGIIYFATSPSSSAAVVNDFRRPKFVFEHPYISSSYYSATSSEKTLKETARKLKENKSKRRLKEPKTRLAVVRPFCEFDAEALPTTFACWNSLAPCKAATADLGDDEMFSLNGTESKNVMADAAADVFLFYSQTFSDNPIALKSVDEIINTFNEPGGWSQCFENIYAIEANIPQELDLYIPSAQEELYNWVNGPNRQYEAAFRIIQSGEWGHYDGFYLMEGDSIPIKSHWLDKVLGAIEDNRPFAILGAKYNGDKWDNFYESIPLSLLHHINGNAIYNTSHPLLERLVGQLEVEAPCPYNSIPYDYRMSQMVVEGALGIVPKLAPKIMLNDDGENITLSDNTEMFARWWDMYKDATPFKETPVIHNYAATNLIPRHLGPEYIIHGAKLYSPWDPTKTEITLVISEWFNDRSSHLLAQLDTTDHPFSQVIVMLPPNIAEYEEYNMTVVPTRAHHRSAPDYMDLCEAPVETDWFMLTNSYHHVATHVDLMFTPATFKPVIPFTPATFPFCLKFPYCKESVMLAQRINPTHDKVVQDFDMLYHTETRNKYCQEWKEEWGEEGEDLYKKQKMRLLRRKKIIGPKGPTGTGYTAYLFANKKDGMYKLTDRSLYGARDPFIKIFAKEEKLDGMTDDERAARMGALGDNATLTDCNCKAFESKSACDGSGLGCSWRPLFESCHPPEMIDDGVPICPQTTSPTMSPTTSLAGPEGDSEEPTASPTAPPNEADPWFGSLFRVREHEASVNERALDEEGDLEEGEEGTGGGNETDLDLEFEDFEEGEDVEDGEFGDNEEVTADEESENAESATAEEDGDKPEASGNEESSSGSEGEVEVDSSTGRRLSSLFTSTAPRRKLQVYTPQSPVLLQKLEQHYWNQVSSKRNVTHLPTIVAPNSRLKVSRRKLVSVSPVETSSVSLQDVEMHYLNSILRKNKEFANSLERQDHLDVRRQLAASASDSPDVNTVQKQAAAVDPLTAMEQHYQKVMEKTNNETDENEYNDDYVFWEDTSLHSSEIDADSMQQNELCPSWNPSVVPPTYVPMPSPPLDARPTPLPPPTPLYPAPHHHMGLSTPLRKTQSIITIDYKGRHPFEGADSAQLFEAYQKVHRPIRMTFHSSLNETDPRAQRVLETLPKIQEAFEILSVVPIPHPLAPSSAQCGEADIPLNHTLNGVPNTDLLIYLTESTYCSPMGAAATPHYSSVCHFDQHARPVVGALALCLDAVPNEQDLVFSVGQMVGWSPTLFSLYRNPDTGIAWGTSLSEVTCGDGSTQIMELPNVVSPQDEGKGFEIVTPTVVQVARNQFDCQTLTGVPFAGDKGCFGNWFDQQFFYNEGLFTPLTLALLEDSGWYQVDYRKASPPNAFGRGAGCGFVKGACGIDGDVPLYAKGFYERGSGCDYTHSSKAEHVELGEGEEIDHERRQEECPMRRKTIASCSDKSQKAVRQGEVFGDHSRCFEMVDGNDAVCLETFCSHGKVHVMLDGHVKKCDFDGMTVELQDYEIQCPRAAVVCNRDVCPGNCSGRGVCDYCREVPECVCDDPFDVSEGCWGVDYEESAELTQKEV